MTKRTSTNAPAKKTAAKKPAAKKTPVKKAPVKKPAATKAADKKPATKRTRKPAAKPAPQPAHAKLSPSGSYQWLNCPGSVKAQEVIPDESNEYAEEGTRAHEAAEALLTGKTPKYDNDEMRDHVEAYAAYCRNLPGQHFVEMRVDYSPWVPDGFGTADFVAIEGTHCDVTDKKYGFVWVDAVNNPQLKLYALGVLHTLGMAYDITDFTLRVYQPRRDNISEWHITVAELLNWAETVVVPAVEAIQQTNPPRIPGDPQCTFCSARGGCRELADHVRAITLVGFDKARDPEKLEPDEVAALLDQKHTINSFLVALEAFAANQALTTKQAAPGYKLVRGVKHRAWKDESAATAALRKTRLKVREIFTSKLVSPAQIEKLLGKGHEVMANHVIKPEGELTIAPLSDNRAPVELDTLQGFDK